MKTNMKVVAALLLVGGLTACGGSSDTEDTTEKTNEARIEATAPTEAAADAQEDDAEFLAEAASASMMEVELGKLALEKSTSPKVKDFARMIVDDHTKAIADLENIATQKNVALPVALMDKHQKMVDKIKDEKGKEFDKKYLDAMVSDHKEDIEEFKEISEETKDLNVKEFAAKSLPKLAAHLEMAERLERAMK